SNRASVFCFLIAYCAEGLYNLFRWMGFIIPFITVMFNETLNATQIAIILIASALTRIATEIPSGAIADKYSRRYVLISACMLIAIGLLVWIFFPNFLGYLVGYILFGLSDSLVSGCEEALLYDELGKFKKRNLFERVHGRAGAFSSVGIFIASVGSFFFIKIGFGYNFLILTSIAVVIIASFILLTIKPVKRIKESEEPESVLSYMETLKEGLKYSFNHKLVLKMILFLSFVTYINIGALEYIGIFYQEITNDLSMVAVLSAIGSLAFAAGRFSGEYLKKLPIKILFSFFLVGSSLDLVTFSLYSYPLSIITLTISTVLICGVCVNTSARMNDLIPGKIRATIISVRGFIESIGVMICLFAFGQVVDYFDSYQSGFLTFVCLSIIGSVVFLISFVRDKNLK
ncbi:MFS transporter, partial [Pseudomonadota bacterium]